MKAYNELPLGRQVKNKMQTKATISKQMLPETLDTITTWHIHLKGRVQGVGFRPYTYQQAVALGLKGEVSNGVDGVHIRFNALQNIAKKFLEALLDNAPSLAVVTEARLEKEMDRDFVDFSIVAADEPVVPDLWITPDFALCETCKSELMNPADRRYRYPFITCTECGPRYSVMRALPFERHLTTMEPFRFCEACQKEFDNPAERRFYAQTMSCPACGVKLEWVNNKGEKIPGNSDEMIGMACKALHAGSIVAVKGIGGFLLLTDACNEGAVMLLRQRKHRPSKPFAIMYPDVEQLQKDAEITPKELAALTSIEAPIVLLPISEQMRSRFAVDALAPGLDKMGIMLPYAPLLLLLAKAFGKPMVATSGNISGAPICFTNEDALTSLAGIADYFLLHNRDIVAPQDDSVISITHEEYPAIFLRRSRGYAPAFETYQTLSAQSILATGALMKSSFTMANHHRVYISQYLGSTDAYEAQLAYRHTLQHMERLLRFEAEVILADAHPQYFSRQLAEEMAIAKGVPCHKIQHHKAHFAAALAEAGLLEPNGPILGVIWDGTGLGDDGNSWGGEFFRFENNCMERMAPLSYFPYLLGDKMAREPRLSALAALHAVGGVDERLQAMFTESEWKLYVPMLENYNGIYSSSMGRLFDAAACLITGISKQSYEGEAAMRLEAMANTWCRQYGLMLNDVYTEALMNGKEISGGNILKAVLQDIQQRHDKSHIAAKFHATMAAMIGLMATYANAEHICFSGGVFQNALLVKMIIAHYKDTFQLHFHRQLSPNDENISFGQLVYYDRDIK
jgi:hydrogenase maturation protein HypF